MHRQLTLVTREDCELCEHMLADLLALRVELDLPVLVTLDVDSDPELLRRYALKVPVLLLNGAPVFHGQLDVAEFKRLLRPARF